MRKPIGGELAFKLLGENVYFTDSGRSSLRLFIRSGNRDKKFLIPDFFCEVIENILIQEKVNYEFYHILEDLTIDIESVFNKQYDVFYIINYFGQLSKIKHLNVDDKIIIEDNVFLYDFENTNSFKHWFGFNSFRKISPLADGSLIKTNLDIDGNQIIQNQAKFVQRKYEAKNLKYEYLYNNIGEEKDYISLFEVGEGLLNDQRNIYNMSPISIFQMMQYNQETEQRISKEYYNFLLKEFKSSCLNYDAKFYSFFVIKLSRRDELRRFLFSKNIFLPVHWPKSSKENTLYNEVISIPLFSSYSMDDMVYIATSIKEFYEKY